jgi:hypothetical protein
MRSELPEGTTQGYVKASRKGELRHISIVKDPEGKSRVIAIGDYWSQAALKPIHDTVKAILKRIGETDCTYNQRIAPFGDQSQLYHSFDLTAATDRIPVEIYKPIKETLFGRDYSLAWKDILVSLPFRYQGEDKIYACGQPKGKYSSWTLLALSHHLIIRFAASRVGIQGFRDYRV